jgi:seryl-tRNA synthetase
MHDAKALLDGEAALRLARRGYELDTGSLASLVGERARLIAAANALRAALNRLTHEASGHRGQPAGSADRAIKEAREIKDRFRELEEQAKDCTERLRALLLSVPNLPADDAPDGSPADPMVEIRRWGRAPDFGFPPADHLDVGVALGILDPARAAKLSGSRFAVTSGAGAKLERALAEFLLDLHTAEHGYTEHGLPHLVNAETMTGTGQLPKFAEDLFTTSVAGRELLLIPTAEVPLVNLYRDELIEDGSLPLALTARTPCYRREAGSYGRDTRGLIRLHQFEKVELVRICHPDDAASQLELIRSHAEEALRKLGLHYRVVDLRAGDLGFSARRTYDLEVWLPSQQAFREISSCSDCGTFQARRANIRMRDRGGQKAFPVTLNASGLPIGRTIAALLEQNQRADGSVTLPPALAAYAGFNEIGPRREPAAGQERVHAASRPRVTTDPQYATPAE